MSNNAPLFGTSRPRVASLALALATSLIAAASTAHAQDVDGLNVSGALPTTLTVPIAGLGPQEVGKAVRTTAFTVCRNAVSNGELDPFDIRWCAETAAGRTMRHYRSTMLAAERSGPLSLVLGPPAGRSRR